MTPIQQLMLGAGGASGKTYIEDLFSTYLHAGNETAKSIVNGVDLTKGGMVWSKGRSHWNQKHYLFDTVRGATKYVKTNENNAEESDNNTLTSFNNNGFSLGVDTSQNENSRTYSTWSFREAPGFFDVVKYTGGSGTQTISHNLGCVPGMILVKALDTSDNWAVYHRNMDATSPNNYGIKLNTDGARFSGAGWNVTATTFDASFSLTNADGGDFIAYLFAGGESTASEAVSVDLDGSDDELKVANSGSDFQFGTGDFTVECWAKWDVALSGARYIIDMRSSAGTNIAGALAVGYSGDNTKIEWGIPNTAILEVPWADYISVGTWNHIAVARSGSTIKMFINGTEVDSATDNNNYDIDPTDITIGDRYNNSAGSQWFNGKISNVRIVKGTAVYTSSFRPPTEPLTNITNTKLLCCNGSSTTSSTVTPGTITANGSPTASTDSPFDDPAAFTFGESGSESVIKTGSYVGNGGTGGPKISLGFEPQFILVKNTSDTGNWYMFDSIRGIATNHNDAKLSANEVQIEETDAKYIDLNATGFQIVSANSNVNGTDDIYIYISIRRPDSYVSRPVEDPTSVFAMDTGNSSSSIPSMDSNFAVDMAIYTQPASTAHNWLTARLIGQKELKINGTDAEGSVSDSQWDSNVGWGENHNSNYQSWLWKRNAGFDVVTYTGDSTDSHQIPHSLSKAPEMMWIKCRSATKNWSVYHKGLDGGSSPEDYVLFLNNTDAELDDQNYWNDTAPTATNFTVGNSSKTNSSGETFIAMLFASVDGISKVGSYTGTGSTLNIEDPGFQPRFLILKRTDGSGSWFVFDTTRGWGSGNDNFILLNDDDAQDGNYNIGEPISNGFQLNGSDNNYNASGLKYIYYAHA